MIPNCKPKKIAIFGASGFAREVADICLEVGYRELVFLGETQQSSSYFGYPLLPENEAVALYNQGWQFVIGIGDNQSRKKVLDKFPDLPYTNVTHPTATCRKQEWQNLFNGKKGNIVAAGVRFTTNIVLGGFGIYDQNCTIAHDCILDDFIHIAPSANISGNVHLAEGVYVGTNAAVLQGVELGQKMEVGSFATIGAGAVVTKNVTSRTIVVGIPARPLVQCSEGWLK